MRNHQRTDRVHIMFPDHRRLSDIDNMNRRSRDRAEKFMSDFKAGNSSFADFSRLKHEFPFHGIMPCRAQDLDFVMFHANDDIVAWEYFWFGPDGYEQWIVRSWIDMCRRPGVVLDIGGYSGLMSILAAIVHPKNEVHLFEPIDRTIERANVNMKLNGLTGRVKLHHFAASDRDGEAVINLYRDENFLGTGNSIFHKEKVPVVDRKTIRTVALDNYLAGLLPSTVKIDVEGHELACLGGMMKMLKSARPHLIIEVWEHSRDEVLSLLRGLDYSLTRVERGDRPVNNYVGFPK